MYMKEAIKGGFTYDDLMPFSSHCQEWIVKEGKVYRNGFIFIICRYIPHSGLSTINKYRYSIICMAIKGLGRSRSRRHYSFPMASINEIRASSV